MKFHQSVFGGELTMLTYGEMDKRSPDALKDGIIHDSIF